MSCFCLPPLNVTKLFIYVVLLVILVNSQWQMQDNLEGDANTKGGNQPIIWPTFAKNCMIIGPEGCV